MKHITLIIITLFLSAATIIGVLTINYYFHNTLLLITFLVLSNIITLTIVSFRFNNSSQNIGPAIKKISHDLKTPIAGLNLLTSSQRDLQLEDKEILKEISQRIDKITEQLQKLIP